MQSLEIVLTALAVMLVGATALYYQFTGARRFETLIAFCGVALVASGFAMFQDGVAGSRKFLWMLPRAEAAASTQPIQRVTAQASVFRASGFPD
jgi:hypothetical protein